MLILKVRLCRSQRTLENRLTMDDEKVTLLEQQVRSLKATVGSTEQKYEEVSTGLCSNVF